VFGIPGRKRTARREHRLWSLAGTLVPVGRSSEWNQALMDLGATICTARKPRCPACPVRPECVFGVRSNRMTAARE